MLAVPARNAYRNRGRHDPVFTTALGEVFRSEGLRIITILPKTPRMNSVCERVNGTLRRELPDRTLILGERHLALVLAGS